MLKYLIILISFVLFTSFQPTDGLPKGAAAPDFTVTTADGENFRLSDLQGSLVYIDFWASWCQPCRKQNITLIKIQEKYRLIAKQKGIPIFFLSISLDTNKEHWKIALARDNMNIKKQVCDLKGWDSEIVKLYQVIKVPSSFLIGTTGKIVERDIWGTALDEVLERQYKLLSN